MHWVVFDDFDALLAKIAADHKLDLAGILTDSLTSFGIGKISLSTWSELENLDQNQDLFETLELFEANPSSESANVDGGEIISQEIFLVNCENLSLTKESLEFVSSWIETNPKSPKSGSNKEMPKAKNLADNIYLYNSKEWTASDKTLLKKHKVNLQNLKLEESVKFQLAQSYNQKLDLSLIDSQLEKLIFGTTSLQEIINKLDFLSLTENPKQHLDQVTTIAEPLLFMLDLSPRSLPKWQTLVTEDNLQLALSLIFGKLEKKNPTLAGQVITTDQKIKTRGGIRPLLWWKMLLWQLQKTN